MYAEVRTYQGVTHFTQAKQRVSEEFVPLISKLPGFVACFVVDAGDGVVVSTSVFEDKAGAEESTKKAAEFVREHLAAVFPHPPEVTAGEVVASDEASRRNRSRSATQ